MKVFSPYNSILSIMILLLSFSFISNDDDPCKYKLSKEGNELSTDSNYLNGITDDAEKKQKCFSLSHSDFFTDLCCYKSSSNSCVKVAYTPETSPTIPGGVVCAEKSKVYNNCGMSGVYQPETSEICTEISLVQGYCCYVKTKNHGTGCVRTKELEKDKNTPTEKLKKYVSSCDGNAEIESVVCKGNSMKFTFLLLIFTVIFL